MQHDYSFEQFDPELFDIEAEVREHQTNLLVRRWIEALAGLPTGNDNVFAPGYCFRGVRREFSAEGYNYQKFDVEFWRGSLLRFLTLRPTMSFALYLSIAEEPKFQQHAIQLVSAAMQT
jgi:hypothetical protein